MLDVYPVSVRTQTVNTIPLLMQAHANAQTALQKTSHFVSVVNQNTSQVHPVKSIPYLSVTSALTKPGA